MVKNRLNFDEIQDQHLDEMIRLAFKQADALEIQRIMESCSNANVMDAGCDEETVYAHYLDKLKAEEKREKRSNRTTQFRKWMPRLVEIAACLVLITGITAPIAIANVQEIRAKVLEVLIRIEEKYTEVGLIESEEDVFYVPNEWRGQYYPTYIPDGYELKSIGQWNAYLEFENENGKELVFHECTSDTSMNLNSEGAIVINEKINGADALIFERDGHVTLVWWIDDRFFVIRLDEPRNETMKIAENVKKILK